jgi:monofunctional biosynthetic peptidoglycan transglycosylase
MGRTRGRWKKLRWLRRGIMVALFAITIDLLYVAVIWPDWEALASGPVPKSNFIIDYEASRADNAGLPPLRWQPVPLSGIAPIMHRVVVISEDSRFWRHPGIDTAAIADAMEYNLTQGKLIYGGSTISQQTTKNLFLHGTRDPLRKWHELVLTLAMERYLHKTRILEIYLNVAELGVGVFGVEAAARHYFGASAAELTTEQAIALAASLPSPRLHNPHTATRVHHQRRQRISRHLAAFSRTP